MIPPSVCPHWQPDPRQLNPAQEQRSYTTSGNTISTPVARQRYQTMLTETEAYGPAPPECKRGLALACLGVMTFVSAMFVMGLVACRDPACAQTSGRTGIRPGTTGGARSGNAQSAMRRDEGRQQPHAVCQTRVRIFATEVSPTAPGRGPAPVRQATTGAAAGSVSAVQEFFRTPWPNEISPDGLWRINGPWIGTGGNLLDPGLAQIVPLSRIYVGQSYLKLSVAAGQRRGSEVQTLRGYGYGYYEVRMRVAHVPGVTSSFFWIQGPHYGPREWDIEFLTNEPWIRSENSGIVHLTIHPGNVTYVLHLGFNPAKSFHDYGFLWTPGRIVLTVDGKAVHRFTTSLLDTSAKGFIMMNTWTGNPNWGGGPPDHVATTIYDWVWFTPGATHILHPRGACPHER